MTIIKTLKVVALVATTASQIITIWKEIQR